MPPKKPPTETTTADKALTSTQKTRAKRTRANTTLEDGPSTPKPAAKKGKKSTGQQEPNEEGMKTFIPISKTKTRNSNQQDDSLSATTEDAPPVEEKATRKSKAITPRDPLPERERNANPGAPDKPKVYRTSAQVDKLNVEHERLSAQIQALQDKRTQLRGEVKSEQSKLETAEKRTVISSRTDFNARYSVSADVSTAEEAVDTIDEVITNDETRAIQDQNAEEEGRERQQDPSDEDEDFFDIGDDAVEDIEENAADVSNGKGGIKGSKKKNESAEKVDQTVKKPSNPRPDLAGINPQWLSNAVARRAASSTKAKNVIGGLDDEDASDVRVVAARKAPANLRRNDLVVVVAEDSDEEEEHEPIKPKHTKKSVQIKSEPKTPIPKANTSSTTPRSSKTPKTKSVKKEPSVISVSSAADNDADQVELPAFIRAKWEAQFLPTLYHRFFASEQPFAILTKGSPELMDAINETLNAVIPKHSYVVREGSKMYESAYAYLGEKVSKLGSRALSVVNAHFAKDEYTKDPAAMKAYLSWAMRADGPAIWGIPTPQICKVRKGDEGYIAPDNIFEAYFVVETATPILKLMKNSVGNFGHPCSGVALAAAAVQRAFSFIRTKSKQPDAKIRPFSRDQISHVVHSYIDTATTLTDRRWSKLLTIFGAVTTPDVPMELPGSDSEEDFSLHTRIEYIPSSP